MRGKKGVKNVGEKMRHVVATWHGGVCDYLNVEDVEGDISLLRSCDVLRYGRGSATHCRKNPS